MNRQEFDAEIAKEDGPYMCASCCNALEAHRMEADEKYCWYCQSYWDDCASGAFDDVDMESEQ